MIYATKHILIEILVRLPWHFFHPIASSKNIHIFAEYITWDEKIFIVHTRCSLPRGFLRVCAELPLLYG